MATTNRIRTLTALAAASTVIGLTAGCSTSGPGTTTTTDSPTSGSSDQAAETSPSGDTTAGDADYRDGDYEATGEYGGLPSHLDVALTIADGDITNVTVTPTATNETSLGYQQDFADAVPDVVIGKPLAEVSVGKLAGSSSCGDGFNDAIAQIREQAAA
ncbi:hypothetical protein [Curtobacterium sp. MCSS17_008]|uniref:hypothetical protein n=1 Tax=Curtobacterium sp. MCSS17_008 TaxID=2175647 RepID=UPI0015E89BF7|nr:hypothetical protein [Curtobacterium sp. MCSS17_008]